MAESTIPTEFDLEQLGSTAPLLGAVNGNEFFNDAAQTRLADGDVLLISTVLLIYTDGLSEASNPRGIQLGTEGVQRLILEACTNPHPTETWPRAMLNGVLNYRQWTDDTLVVAIYGSDSASGSAGTVTQATPWRQAPGKELTAEATKSAETTSEFEYLSATSAFSAANSRCRSQSQRR